MSEFLSVSGPMVPAMSDEDMTFGGGGRPLATARDRQAEELRLLLRSNGFSEFGEQEAGFVVEDPGEGPLLLAHAGDHDDGEDLDLRYHEVLRMVGYLVEPDATGEGDGWQVWPASAG